MFFPDVLKFFNRLGVRSVNDVTAQVTAGVTAGMDPEGMGAHMGAGLQAPASDHNILLAAISKCENNVTTRIDTVVKKESDERKKAIKDECNARNKAIKGESKERKKAIEGEGRQRKKDIKGMKADLKAQNEDIHQRLELHNEDLQQRLELLEQGAAKNKKPRHEAEDAPGKTKNINWNKLRTSCGWKKTIKGVSRGNNGFSSAEDALLDMERFYAAAVDGASRQ